MESAPRGHRAEVSKTIPARLPRCNFHVDSLTPGVAQNAPPGAKFHPAHRAGHAGGVQGEKTQRENRTPKVVRGFDSLLGVHFRLLPLSRMTRGIGQLLWLGAV